MEIKILKLGKLETNCYVLSNDNKVVVIDPAADSTKIIDEIGNKKLVAIIVTHHHPDHVGALEDLVSYFNVPVYDKNNLEEKMYDLDGFSFEVIYTEGHTDDSISLYFYKENAMFVGDFIFKNSIGRTDLGGNSYDMEASIEKIKKYNNIILYPGHGEITNINDEKENNYYFNK